MISAEKCYRFAKECIELAGETPNAHVRETMLSMAEAWLEIATFGTAISDPSQIPGPVSHYAPTISGK